jgi:sugar phosphate isomerase/epimerase
MSGTKDVTLTVFTKPWKAIPLPELGELVSRLGFDGIELPVRPGYQVEPETVTDALPTAAKTLSSFGVEIISVAGPTDEATIRACGEASIPIIRTMARIEDGIDYLSAVTAYRKTYDALIPLLDHYGVTIGVQNHCNRFVANAVGLRSLLKGYDPQHVAAVWDAAHEALSGNLPDLALDVIWPHLCMVNLKNGFWRRVNGPEAEQARWMTYWTSGRQGLADWAYVVEELKARDYSAPVCLTAEYSDHDAVNRLIAEDIAFAKSLFDEPDR